MLIALVGGKRGSKVERGVESILPPGQIRILRHLASGVARWNRDAIFFYTGNLFLQISGRKRIGIWILPFHPVALSYARFGGVESGVARVESILPP